MMVSNLFIYPVKSTRASACHRADVDSRGLQFDRRWAIFDETSQVITARSYPKLLTLRTEVRDNQLFILTPEAESIEVGFESFTNAKHSLKIFKYPAEGFRAPAVINDWLSQYLDVNCGLYHMPDQLRRPVLAKHGGKPKDLVSFADQAPILLITEGSLNELNQRLEQPVSLLNFRPNIVVNHPHPFQEDNWRQLRIGPVLFDVIQGCARCVFITIDPVTLQKNEQQEPLKTLSGYRKSAKGHVNFGVHLVPRTRGVIAVGDPIDII